MQSVSIEALKTRFNSKSKYMPIWKQVKQTGICTIEVLDSTQDTIIEAVTRLKKLDYHYRAACDLEQGHEFKLVFEYKPESSSLTIKLKDTVNKEHKFNLL